MSAFGRSANRCLAGRDPGGRIRCPVRQQRGILDSALRWVTNGPVQQSPSCSNRPRVSDQRGRELLGRFAGSLLIPMRVVVVKTYALGVVVLHEQRPLTTVSFDVINVVR